jgi:hypothetical protein
MGSKLFFSILFFVGSLFSDFPPHKFYVSVTNIEYAEKEESIQVISRIFVEDMDQVLSERYGIEANLGTSEEISSAKAYIDKYFKAKFKIWINNEPKAYTFLGYRFDKDLIVCYLESQAIDSNTLESLAVENTLLMDIFEEQRNLVHFKILEAKKSVVLTTDNTKGMLNF